VVHSGLTFLGGLGKVRERKLWARGVKPHDHAVMQIVYQEEEVIHRTVAGCVDYKMATGPGN